MPSQVFRIRSEEGAENNLVLLSKPNCSLCDEAREVILSVRDETPFEYQEVFVDGDDALETVDALMNVATIVLLCGDRAAHEDYLRKAFEVLRRNPARTPAVAISLMENQRVLAASRMVNGDLVEAEALLREAVRICRTHVGHEHLRTAEAAIKATRLGAYEYLVKPFKIPELVDLVEKAVDARRLMSEPVEVGRSKSAQDAIIGRSRAMVEVYKAIGLVSAKPVSVLIRGETGTGKELVARYLYQHSERAGRALIVVNCPAIPENLLESELFGHEAGAFTDAKTRRIGRFEQADRGTIFLDEIGDMDVNLQQKLLRVLQEKTIQRIGGQESFPIDVRVLAATHRDLEVAIREKRFREDLYYRLNDAVIRLPPLRERLEDIPDLVRHFLQQFISAKRPRQCRLGGDSGRFLLRPTAQHGSEKTLRTEAHWRVRGENTSALRAVGSG